MKKQKSGSLEVIDAQPPPIPGPKGLLMATALPCVEYSYARADEEHIFLHSRCCFFLLDFVRTIGLASQVDRTATAQAEEIAAHPASPHNQKAVFRFDAAKSSMVRPLTTTVYLINTVLNDHPWFAPGGLLSKLLTKPALHPLSFMGGGGVPVVILPVSGNRGADCSMAVFIAAKSQIAVLWVNSLLFATNLLSHPAS